MRLTHLGTPSLLRRTQRIRERSRAFFDTFPPRDGRFPFSRNEREAFLEQNREAYDGVMNAMKGLETEFASLTQKPKNFYASRGAALRFGRSWRFFRVEREELRVLVRAAK